MTRTSFSRWCHSALLWLALVGSVSATDYLDGQGKIAWSPDAKWVAFNWPRRNELFVVAVESPRAFLLKPVGELDPDNALTVSAEAPVAALARGKRREAVTTPSPGYGKLTLERWAPDSRTFLYRYGKGARALFAVEAGQVTRKLAATEPAPWAGDSPWRVEFEHTRPVDGQTARMLLRVVATNGEVIAERAFTDAVEVAQLASMRFRDISFLAPSRSFLLYPRHATNGWMLVRDPVRTREAPRQLGAPVDEAPYEWELTPDGEYLAVSDRQHVTVGPVDDWTRARAYPLTAASPTLQWSPGGQWLAFQTKQLLHVVSRENGEPRLAADFCAPRFWGWRGERLLFGHARSSVANLYVVEPGGGQAEPLVTAPHWQAAPVASAVSAEGQRIACLVQQFDGNGVAHWELWVAPVAKSAKWELIFSWRS